MERQELLELALEQLGKEFYDLDLTFHRMKGAKKDDITSYWPGAENEEILVCVFKGKEISEPFHRQDFFFINYAYRQNYQALSAKDNHLITIRQDECYISQPYSGYALRCSGQEDTIIIGVLIKRNLFFREYLPTVYSNTKLFRFFIEPQKNQFSDEYIHLSVTKDRSIRTVLEMMVIEYAKRKEDTQPMLKAMLQTLFLQIARECHTEKTKHIPTSKTEQIIRYIEEHSDTVTLKEVAKCFSYHPNYLSVLIHKETGRKFSEILLEKRMERAALLLKNTDLSIEEIALMIGYSDKSNFYKVFKEYFGKSPREWHFEE